MNDTSELKTNYTAVIGKILSWLFGVAVLACGIINTFWGNDPGFGIFLILLSFVYFLPVNAMFKKITGFSIPGMAILRILLGIFIVWAVLGVGELFDKIDLMMKSF